LKPYWGKPAVRNFRGGRGNMDMAGRNTLVNRKSDGIRAVALIWCASLLLAASKLADLVGESPILRVVRTLR